MADTLASFCTFGVPALCGYVDIHKLEICWALGLLSPSLFKVFPEVVQSFC